MPRAVITVPYEELFLDYGGVTGGWDERGPWTNRNYLVAWADKVRFIAQVAGTTGYAGPTGAGIWSRQVPLQDPDDPSLYASPGLTWRPEGEPLTTAPATWSHAVVTVPFRRPEWNFQALDDPENLQGLDPATPIPYCTQRLKFGAEWVDIPLSTLQYASDGKFAPTHTARRVQTVDCQLVFHRYPLMPFPLLRGYADTISASPFLGCAAETLMYEGAETDRGGNEDGFPTQEVTIYLKWRAQSWNKVFRPDTLAWDYAQTTTGARKYATADFTGLLLSGVGY